MRDLREKYSSDYFTDVRLGKISGESIVSIKGHDEDLSTTKIVIHPTGTTLTIDQSVIYAAPSTVTVSSTSANDTSAGTGAKTVILYGLSASGIDQSETISMNGQIGVTSSLTYSAITGIKSATFGTLTWNDGTIWCGTGTITGGIPDKKLFSMDAQFNKALTAYYVVPSGKTLYPVQFAASISSTSKTVELFIETSDNGTNWFTYYVFGMISGNPSPIKIYNGDPITESQHIRISGVSDAASTDITAIIDCILKTN